MKLWIVNCAGDDRPRCERKKTMSMRYAGYYSTARCGREIRSRMKKEIAGDTKRRLVSSVWRKQKILEMRSSFSASKPRVELGTRWVSEEFERRPWDVGAEISLLIYITIDLEYSVFTVCCLRTPPKENIDFSSSCAFMSMRCEWTDNDDVFKCLSEKKDGSFVFLFSVVQFYPHVCCRAHCKLVQLRAMEVKFNINIIIIIIVEHSSESCRTPSGQRGRRQRVIIGARNVRLWRLIAASRGAKSWPSPFFTSQRKTH